MHLVLAACFVVWSALGTAGSPRPQEPRAGSAAPAPVVPATPAARPQEPAPQLPAGHPPVDPTPQEPAPTPTPAAGGAEQPRPQGNGDGDEAPAGARRGGRGRRGGGDGQGGGDGPGEEAGAVVEPKTPRKGIPVADAMLELHCARCHPRDDNGLMTRISYMRKSPEGWSESLKRMVRLHGLQISPADAKQVVRYLADRHGLTRSEAERSLYESERRVHWSEENEDADFKEACSGCHTLGRVLMQARDAEEWQQLRTTHVAMFPLARGSIGGGPPEDEEMRFGGGGQGAGGGGNAARGGRRGGAAGGGENAQPQRGSRGDRVLTWLAEKQPLFTPEWSDWAHNRRDVPLAGTWTVAGHEIGRGDLLGTAELVRVEDGDYEVRWNLRYQDGTQVVRQGRGLLYGGYSWRGRSTESGDAQGARTWREVLLLDERWDTLKGRFFTGDYDEFGVDVTLHRRRGAPRVLAIAQPFVTVPAEAHALDVHGEAFPESIAASDFQLGLGVTVARVERVSQDHVRLFVDVAPGTPCGLREVAYGAEPARAQIRIYDAVDYVRIRPTQGLSRIGGIRFPKQHERFEAVTVHRGPDEKPFTKDDVDLWMVPATFTLREASFRDDDDDLAFVGQLNPTTGEFTPAVDGPNVQRKWSANNVGEVYVECRLELEVPVRPEPPKKPEPKPEEKPAESPASGERNAEPAHGEGAGEAPAPTEPTQHGEGAPHGEGGGHAPEPQAGDGGATNPRDARPRNGQEPGPGPGAQGGRRDARSNEPPPVPFPLPAPRVGDEPKPVRGKPVLAKKTFRARASLIVTVPQYIRWAALEWEAR